ncbi:MAG: hypothetical protein GY759_19690 [Chloroflexi bacterium]|nr:hypothetical protein [Chloroflexota bacterium]
MKLLLAPAGQGKTAYIIQQIRAERATRPLAPIWVILPNQEQARAFRQRLALAGGALGVEIDTFYGIYTRVLALASEPMPRLFEPVQHRLLRAVVDTLYDEGALLHYAPLRDKPGFLRRLRELILELKQARVEPQVFGRALVAEPRRLSELAAIYQRYQDWLQDSGWADAEGQGWLAALALKDHPLLGGDIHLLAVDGFDEFNPTQLAVLRLLSQRADETMVTLTGEISNAPRDAHRRFTRALIDLRAGFQEVDIRPLPAMPTAKSPILAYLESAIFNPATTLETNPQPSPTDLQNPISLIEARNRAEETRAALHWLKELIVRQDVEPYETAVLARDLEPYRPYLAETADEYGMKLYISGGEELIANPAIAAFLHLLSLPVLEWPQRTVLDAWRSPYFDWPALVQASAGMFDSIEKAAGRLEQATRGSRIIAGLAQWREALERRALTDVVDSAAIDEDRALKEGPIGEEAAVLLRMFDLFVRLLKPAKAAPLAAHIAFVEDLIGLDPGSEGGGRRSEVGSQKPSNGVRNTQPCPERSRRDATCLNIVTQARANDATCDRDITALQAFKDVLRGLLLAENIASSIPSGPAGEPMSYRRFYSELRGAVEAATYRLPQPNQAATLAASLLQARGVSFRAVALLGLSEGEFPKLEREDPLLRDSERESLQERDVKMQPRIQGDEITLFYEAVTRASEHLLLTRSNLSDDGQPWQPSPYWQEVRRLVDVQPVSADATPSPASAPEYLALAGHLAAEQTPDLAEDWRQVQHTAAILEGRQANDAAGVFAGDATAIASQFQSYYSPDHVWSSSSLESYATCPFQFFVRNGLGLEPHTEAEQGYDVLILGNIFHAVLEEIYRQARDQGDWSEAALLALLPEVSGTIFDAAPRRYGFRPTPLWDFQRRELADVLARNLVGLSEMAGDFAPLELEAAFGLKGHPPLDIKTEDGALLLRGYIDRVDQDQHGRLRIIDYKSGSTPIRPNELDEGKRIQLPLYALAAEQSLGLGEVVGGFYWHIGSAKASTLALEKQPGGVESALATAVGSTTNHVRGIRSGRYSPKPPAKGCPGSCPAKEFCWQYRP